MYNPYIFTSIYVPDSVCKPSFKNFHQIFRIKKVHVSYTGKNLVSSPKELFIPFSALCFLSGQRCTVLQSRKSISSWKLRKNAIIGCKVSLTGRKAFAFLEKLYIYGIIKNMYRERYPYFLNLGWRQKGTSLTEPFFELQKLQNGSRKENSIFSGFFINIT